MTSNKGESLAVGISHLVEQLGGNLQDIERLQTDSENYRKWWQQEIDKNKKSEEKLFEVSNVFGEEIMKLEATVKDLQDNLNIIVAESHNPRYNPKKDIEKIKIVLKKLDKK